MLHETCEHEELSRLVLHTTTGSRSKVIPFFGNTRKQNTAATEATEEVTAEFALVS